MLKGYIILLYIYIVPPPDCGYYSLCSRQM